VRISKNPVLLKGVGDIDAPTIANPGVYWNGYIWPDGEVSLNSNNPAKTTATYRAIKTRE
jgi:hypothetical protein